MKKLLLLPAITSVFAFNSCKKNDDSQNNSSGSSSGDKACGDHQGNQLCEDASSTCYYMNNGNKVTVESHECNC